MSVNTCTELVSLAAFPSQHQDLRIQTAGRDMTEADVAERHFEFVEIEFSKYRLLHAEGFTVR
jgi:hypothetical protein